MYFMKYVPDGPIIRVKVVDIYGVIHTLNLHILYL